MSEINSQVVLVGVTRADVFNALSNGSESIYWNEIIAQVAPMAEPKKFGSLVVSFCVHMDKYTTTPSKFVRWTETTSEKTPWISGDGDKHAWTDLISPEPEKESK